MKTCTNCRAIYADGYMGTCHDCGAGMGNQLGQADSLEARFSAQTREASRMRSDEARVEARDYGSISKSNPVFAAAQEFVMDFRTPEQRVRDEATGA